MRKLYCILTWLAITAMALAQAPDCPRDTVNGEEVYKYQVEKSIGLYRVGVNFNVPQSEIIRLNPQLKERGLHYGETILIPTGRKVEKKPEKVRPIKPIETEPVVVAVDTVTKTVPVAEQSGQEDTTAVMKEDSLSRKVVEIALMLPFESKQLRRSANAEKMMDFYLGTLLALHELQNDSTLYRLRVFDTERTDHRVTTLCQGHELDSVKAVLGLAYTVQVDHMAKWCEEHQVPLLVPFTDDIELKGFTQLMQFNAGARQEADSLCRWAQNRDLHCVAVEVREAEISPSIRVLRASMRAAGMDLNVLTLHDLMNDSAAYALHRDKENLIILHSDKFSMVRQAIPHIEALQEAGYRIRLVSRYSWQKERIAVPQVFTSVFSGTGDSGAYEKLWKKYYSAGHPSEAPRYDLLGYDLMHMLVRRLAGETRYNGLQSNMEFQQIGENDGWHNINVRVVEK